MLPWLLSAISRWAIPLILLSIPLIALFRKVNVYEAFVDGAASGFETAVKIIPFLVAMFLALQVFRASGAMDLFAKLLSPLTQKLGIPSEVVPLALIRPFSGESALGISAEIIKHYGPDSLIGRIASTMQGSADATFFAVTLYFGSIGIKKHRHAPLVGLITDIFTLLASVYIVRIILV